MRLGEVSGLALWCLVAPAAALGCNPLVKIDVDCQKLCLTAPGPSLPGIPSLQPAGIDGAVFSIPDADIPSASIEWEAEMKFNEVLKQLPSAAANMSANVRLASVNLTSTTDLSFVDSVDVFLSHGQARADSGASTIVDGGSPATLPCKAAGSSLRVAYFRSPDAGVGGSTLNLVTVDPALNLFDCMKDDPSKFDVKMTFHPGAYPATTTPLTLSTCIGAQAHASYP